MLVSDKHLYVYLELQIKIMKNMHAIIIVCMFFIYGLKKVK